MCRVIGLHFLFTQVAFAFSWICFKAQKPFSVREIQKLKKSIEQQKVFASVGYALQFSKECTDLYIRQTKQLLHKCMAWHRRTNTSGQDSGDHLHLKEKGHSFEESNPSPGILSIFYNLTHVTLTIHMMARWANNPHVSSTTFTSHSHIQSTYLVVLLVLVHIHIWHQTPSLNRDIDISFYIQFPSPSDQIFVHCMMTTL